MIWKKLKPGCFGNMVTNRQFILSWFYPFAMPELRRAAAPVAEDAVAQPYEPPRTRLRPHDRTPEAILRGRDVEGIGRRRWMIRPSSAAGAYGNDGGSQPRPRHSLGGHRERVDGQ